MVLALLYEVENMAIKSKITVVSPVHIGTGDEKLSCEYNQTNNTIACYDMWQLLSFKTNKELLDFRFLNSLLKANQGSKRDELNRIIKKDVDYTKITPSYSLRADFTKQPKQNVRVQLKSLNKPYIPGSSLKGAIMNAIFYDFIKKHLKEFYNYIEENIGKKHDIDSFLKFIDNNLAEFVKQISNCLICRDVYFDRMVLVNTIRNKVYQDEKETSLTLPNFECIDVNQINDDEIITINSDRKIFLEKTKNGKYVAEFIKYLSINEIIKVCRSYFHDILGEEMEMEKNNNYYAKEGLDKSLNDFYNNPVKNGFYMRIGGNTNYFFKTVSYLVKKNNYKFYEKHFYKTFSPKDKPKRKGAYPLPDKMPATRAIFVDDKYAYYPGVIKIEFYKTN